MDDSSVILMKFVSEEPAGCNHVFAFILPDLFMQLVISPINI
jgi:hypothetical protein